ncbi:uncharacterized protein [Dendrobates tinctorius]|uniref:uncharacterized protein isoform X2 n=1 Tax=Dendrobates tinctorius TaxID=92724 RepID=UPI003CCA4671
MTSILLHMCLITGTSALVHNVFAASGETLVLPQYRRLQYTGGALCDQIVWTFRPRGEFLRQLAKVGEYCDRRDCNNETEPRCSLSSNGSLQLYGVKLDATGQYKVTTYNVRREKDSEDTFILQVLGLDPEAGTHSDIYAHPDSNVLLPMRYNLTRDEDPMKCDQFIWIYTGPSESALIARSKGCEMTEHNFRRFSNYNISLDGCLTLINVTRNISGNYTVAMCNSGGQIIFSHNYALYVQEFFWEQLVPHVFTHGVVCVLFSVLLVCFLTDLWKLKKYS